MHKIIENEQPKILKVSAQNVIYLIPDKPIVGSSFVAQNDPS